MNFSVVSHHPYTETWDQAADLHDFIFHPPLGGFCVDFFFWFCVVSIVLP
jgi:hypothetical protein